MIEIASDVNNEVSLYKWKIIMEGILLSSTQRVIIMIISSLTKDEADKLYKIPKSVVKSNNNNRWTSKEVSAENAVSFYLEIDIITDDEDKTELILKAWKGTKGKTRYSFALLNKDKTPIRRWDDQIRHPHPVTKELTKGPHKHYWTEDHEDRVWYHTNDVRVNDPDGAILDFMQECHIETKGFYIQKDTGSAYV